MAMFRSAAWNPVRLLRTAVEEPIVLRAEPADAKAGVATPVDVKFGGPIVPLGGDVAVAPEYHRPAVVPKVDAWGGEAPLRIALRVVLRNWVRRLDETVLDDVAVLRQRGIREHDGLGRPEHPVGGGSMAQGLRPILHVEAAADVGHVVAISPRAGLEGVRHFAGPLELGEKRALLDASIHEVGGEEPLVRVEGFLAARVDAFAVPAHGAAGAHINVRRGGGVSAAVLIRIHGIGEEELAQVVRAGDGVGLAARTAENGEQQARQDADDGDHDEQLDKRKALASHSDTP